MRTRFFHQLVLLAATLFVSGCAAYGPPRHGEKIYRGVVFSHPKGKPLRMDLYVPQTGKPVPVVLWIFGGSWKIGSNGYHVNLRDLPQSGIALASIQYRMSSRAIYPAQLEDCEAAAEFLRSNGKRYGIDPTRIGASGESAGGHLAALLGLAEGNPKIRGVCALYPPTDLVALGRMYSSPNRESDIERLLGGPIEKKLPLARQASPVDQVTPKAPPFLIIHGANDTLVPLKQSQALDHQLREAGIESKLIVVPGKPHWFLLQRPELNSVTEFFKRHFAMER